MEAQIFKALGDPLRLKIVTRLSDGSPYTIGSLTEDLDISRQGARKQLQALASANIVQFKPQGRQINVVLNAAALKSGREFISTVERKWDERLARLKQIVEK